MHEVITLQLGPRANYFGTHYWNTQESYFTYGDQAPSPVDHDISFRAGIGADGHDTYTPRALLYDFKNAFGTLRRENALYEIQQAGDQQQRTGWNGPTIPLRLPAIEQNPYQSALEVGETPPALTTSTVRFWSDYNHLFYHPSSIVQLSDQPLTASLSPFSRWESGTELFADLDREHDLLDRDLRAFLEDCDQLQGIQILTGVSDAWGGFAAGYLERMSDQMGKGCRWVFGVQDLPQQSGGERARARVLGNVAQSLHALDGSASVVVPMTAIPEGLPGYIEMEKESAWHISALQVAAMESVTLPTRLRGAEAGRATFGDLETMLCGEGHRRVAALGMEVDGSAAQRGQANGFHHDARMTNGTNGLHEEDEESSPDTKSDINFFPSMTTSTRSEGRRLGARPHTFSKIDTLRGSAWHVEDDEEEIARRRDLRMVTLQSPLLFPTLSSYPQIFRFQGTPSQLAIKTSLSTSTDVAARIRNLGDVVRRIGNVEYERESLCDGLATMAEEYDEGWDDEDGEYDDD